MKYYLFGVGTRETGRHAERRNIWISKRNSQNLTAPNNLNHTIWCLRYGPYHVLKELKVKRTL